MTKILAVSDVESQYLYKAIGGEKFKDIDFIISCGDLPYYYLEYLVSVSNKDLFYVRGNHAHKVEIGEKRRASNPQGARDLHMKTVKAPGGIILAASKAVCCTTMARTSIPRPRCGAWFSSWSPS